jgi:hypothetical protein
MSLQVSEKSLPILIAYAVQWIDAANPLARRRATKTTDGQGLEAPDTGEWMLHLQPER